MTRLICGVPTRLFMYFSIIGFILWSYFVLTFFYWNVSFYVSIEMHVVALEFKQYDIISTFHESVGFE